MGSRTTSKVVEFNANKTLYARIMLFLFLFFNEKSFNNLESLT